MKCRISMWNQCEWLQFRLLKWLYFKPKWLYIKLAVFQTGMAVFQSEMQPFQSDAYVFQFIEERHFDFALNSVALQIPNMPHPWLFSRKVFHNRILIASSCISIIGILFSYWKAVRRWPRPQQMHSNVARWRWSQCLQLWSGPVQQCAKITSKLFCNVRSSILLLEVIKSITESLRHIL